MRKIFRMGYEPCKGDRYAYDDVLPVQDLAPGARERVMAKLLEMHAPMCGNEALRYGVDLDEERRLFVGFFYHYGAIETFVSDDMISCVEIMSYSKLCSRNKITVSALLSSGAMNSDNARCAHIWCGWRRKDHFGIPPQFCRLRTDGTIDKREKLS